MTTGSGAANVFTAHYEGVRTWALARPRPSVCPSGAATLLQRGVVAWLLAWPTWRSAALNDPAESGAPRGPTVPRVARAARTCALAGVLATMVEHTCQQEERL